VNSPFYPAATSGNTLFYQQRIINNADQGDVKIDWTPNGIDRVFGRYSQQSVRNPTTETYALASNGITNFNYPLKNGVIGWTRTIDPSLINDFRAGFSYFPVSQGFSNPTGQNLPMEFGIPGSPSTFLPAIGGLFGGVGTLANNLGQFNTFADTVFQIGDSIVKTHGNHEFHAGIQFNNYRDNFLFPGIEGLAGLFNFNGQYTGNPTPGTASLPLSSGSGLADFLLGLPNNLGIGSGTGNRHIRNNLWGVYGQDNWRIRPNLTINVGLRWELNTPRTPQDDNAVTTNCLGEISSLPRSTIRVWAQPCTSSTTESPISSRASESPGSRASSGTPWCAPPTVLPASTRATASTTCSPRIRRSSKPITSPTLRPPICPSPPWIKASPVFRPDAP
jgi:hypothetical protein